MCMYIYIYRERERKIIYRCIDDRGNKNMELATYCEFVFRQ